MKIAISLLLPAMLCAGLDDSRTSGKRAGKDAPPAASRQSSITGCLDQHGEAYVIRSTDDMARVMALEGKGFSDDNFARYIGRQVRVHGKVSSGETFQVTKIEKLADTCSK